MISPDAIQKICDDFGIGERVVVGKVQKGVLNHNYILTTTTGKYFIKSVREKAKDRLATIYGVESFMKLRGIPAIAMMKTGSGEIFVADGAEVFTLYPFVEAEESENYSGEDYRRMGGMLGEIHYAGSGDIAEVPGLKHFKRPDDGTIREKLKNYKRDIEGKSALDETDKLFLEYINLKLGVSEWMNPARLENDTLVHGDYHPGNILLDKNTQEIIGICDWEKTEFGPRAYELARSLLYSCFSGKYEISQALKNAELFLEGYLSVYFMDAEEIMKGLKIRIHRMILSSWLEEKYYKDKDGRGNHFIKHEMNIINDVVSGGLLEKIRDLIKWTSKKN